MSTQDAFYSAGPSMDSSIAPESLLLANGFSPGFLSLALLEKGHHHQDVGMPFMQIASNQKDTAQAVASNMQGYCNDKRQLNIYNFSLRPASPVSCEVSIDAETNPAMLFSSSERSTPSLPSFPSTSSAADDDPQNGSDHNYIAQHSSACSNKSTFPLHWQTDDTNKRAIHRKRNRAAASKSRQRKKRETNQLQRQFQEVSRRRGGLEDEVRTLRSQLLSLKDQILMHSQCDDKTIHLYLDCMVKQAMGYDSVSSTLIAKPNGDDGRNQHQVSGSVSPSQNAIGTLNGHPHHHAHNPS